MENAAEEKDISSSLVKQVRSIIRKYIPYKSEEEIFEIILRDHGLDINFKISPDEETKNKISGEILRLQENNDINDIFGSINDITTDATIKLNLIFPPANDNNKENVNQPKPQQKTETKLQQAHSDNNVAHLQQNQGPQGSPYSKHGAYNQQFNPQENHYHGGRSVGDVLHDTMHGIGAILAAPIAGFRDALSRKNNNNTTENAGRVENSFAQALEKASESMESKHKKNLNPEEDVGLTNDEVNLYLERMKMATSKKELDDITNNFMKLIEKRGIHNEDRDKILNNLEKNAADPNLAEKLKEAIKKVLNKIMEILGLQRKPGVSAN